MRELSFNFSTFKHCVETLTVITNINSKSLIAFDHPDEFSKKLMLSV